MITTTHVGMFVLFVWNIFLTWAYLDQKKFFKSFTKNIAKTDLKTLLKQIGSSLKKVTKQLAQQQQEITHIHNNSVKYFQKLGFIRFNPFSDTGGDQSFCVCMLDDGNNGFVITSLHSREQTRIYSKQILSGKSMGIDFSKEEKEALSLAQKNK